MGPKARLLLIAIILVISAVYAVLLAMDPHWAAGAASGYVAILLTVLALVGFWKKPHDGYASDRRQESRRTKDRRKPSRTIQRLAELIVVGMLVQLLVIGYVFITEYNGRVDAINAARQGCERDKLDRRANASGWRVAESARRREGMNNVADFYGKIATGMEKRARINCRDRYPNPEIFP